MNPDYVKYFAPTVPPQILKGLKVENALGTYQFLLAHDVSVRPDEYRQALYLRDVNIKPPRYIIMDNSIIELKGATSPLRTVVGAVNAVGANVVILPDVLEDAKATVDSIQSQFDIWNESMPRVSFMIVPQGKTLEEFTWCAEQLMRVSYKCTWWGIPRNLVALHGTRRHAIDICRTLSPTKHIHLLGMSDNFIDDILCMQLPGAMGIDSAVPCRIVNHDIPLSMVMKVPSRGNWWDEAEYHPQMAWNMKQVRSWINETPL